ncbi:MAG: signal peptidase I [Planctomycetota bacterium]
MMSKTKTVEAIQPSASRKRSSAPATQSTRKPGGASAVRETIESIVIAFILAFLFRTFEAEAFVIPTGSMATTLMGRHKDLECPVCHYAFQVSASEEVDGDGNSQGADKQVTRCVCPMCRYSIDLSNSSEYPSYKGDRIIVGKFAYAVADPERWDVAVFKYPQDAPVNYIKRVVGLPGETLLLRRGDVYVRPNGQQEFEIARKPPHKLLAMLRPVFDNAYMPAIAQYGFGSRWRVIASGAQPPPGGWSPSADLLSFEASGESPDAQWLRYQHLIPDQRQWRMILDGQRLTPSDKPLPHLISDFVGYNTGRQRGSEFGAGPFADEIQLPLNWVSDLALECEVESLDENGQLILELVAGGWRFQCVVDIATGQATLGIDGPRAVDYRPTAQTALKGRGRHRVVFANCDQQLRLWIDGRLVEFPGGDAATAYPPLQNDRPTVADLEPVGIASVGAAVRVSKLRVLRDLYYIAQRPTGRHSDSRYDESGVAPSKFAMGQDWSAFEEIRTVDFTLGADEYLMLGDNSAKSADSRMWESGPAVRRDLLIGKAIFIYWPHAFYHVIPNFARMGFVR